MIHHLIILGIVIFVIFSLVKTQPKQQFVKPLNVTNQLVIGKDVNSLSEAARLASTHPKDRIEKEDKTIPNPRYNYRSHFDTLQFPDNMSFKEVKAYVQLLSPSLKPNALIKGTESQLIELQKAGLVSNNSFNNWCQESCISQQIVAWLYDEVLYQDPDSEYYRTSLHREAEVLEAYEWEKEFHVTSVASGVHAFVLHTMYPKLYILWAKQSNDQFDQSDMFQELKRIYENYSSKGGTNTTQYSR